VVVMRNRPKTSTFWVRTFADAKTTGMWTVVPRRYTKRYAQAVACDIRSSHRRKKPIGIAGLCADDHWDAVWEAPANPSEDSWNYTVAIKYRGKRKTNKWRN
jgi:hypothetical protein